MRKSRCFPTRALFGAEAVVHAERRGAIVEGLIAQGHSARQHAAEQVWPDPTCNTVAEGGCPMARSAV